MRKFRSVFTLCMAFVLAWTFAFAGAESAGTMENAGYGKTETAPAQGRDSGNDSEYFTSDHVIIIIAVSAGKVYDGEPLSAPGFWVLGLPEGFSIKA